MMKTNRSVGLALAAALSVVLLAGCGLAAVAAGAIILTARNTWSQGDNGREAQAFIAQLQREQPTLSALDTLYVVRPPRSLNALGPRSLYEAVQVFYPDVTVTVSTEAEAAKVEATRDPHARVIRVPGR